MQLRQSQHVEYILSCGHRTMQDLQRIQNTVLCFKHWHIQRVFILETVYEKSGE